MQDENILHVKISKATKVVWEGNAVSVSSKNSNGDFDILGMHSNFITLIRKDPIKVIDVNGKEKVYTFDQSVLSVNSNNVKIFSDIE